MRLSVTKNKLMILLFGVCVSSQLHAWEAGGSIGINVESTDNSRRAAINAQNDLITTAVLTGTLKENTGPLSIDLAASQQEKNYAEDTYENEGYFSLRGIADWEAVRERLSFNVSDFYKQSKTTSINPLTPDNIQDTNVFSFTPRISMPVPDRHSLTVQPSFKDFYYETSDLDSQQVSLQIDWLYSLFRTMNVGLGGNYADTEYDNDVLNPNYTSQNIYLIIDGQRALFKYTVNLGQTHFERENFSDQDGKTGNVVISTDLSSRSSLRLRMASNLTDTNSAQFNSSLNILNGNPANQQFNNDVFRNNILRIQYNHTGTRLDSIAWVELRDLDYKETQDDREVDEIGFRLNYDISSVMTAGLAYSFNDTTLTSSNRSDEENNYELSATYRFSRNISSTFNLSYIDKNSNVALFDYDETAVSLGLKYSFDRQ